jgi:mannose-1-phosphate guanylyltransferase
MEHTYAIIMAGGGGTRLWPISRKKHPKHILPLLGERTLFQITLDRLDGLVPVERTMIITTTDQVEELTRQAPQLPGKNFFVEPVPRGTASAIGLAAAVLGKLDPEAVMLTLPSDHFIRNRDLFHLLMQVALQVARKGYLVTLGITPTFPATGYGYIQRSTLLPGKFAYPVYSVQRFTEKPNEEMARQLLASGDYSWNSGMFIWRADQILAEIARLMPDLKGSLDRVGTAWNTSKKDSVLRTEWLNLVPQTIDYGIMEQAKNVVVLPAGGLEWSDVGSWDSLFEIILPDADGNIVVNCEHISLDSHDSLIYSTGKKLVTTIGVDNLIVIDSGDSLLICRRDQAQQVREVIERLKREKKNKFL